MGYSTWGHGADNKPSHLRKGMILFFFFFSPFPPPALRWFRSLRLIWETVSQVLPVWHCFPEYTVNNVVEKVPILPPMGVPLQALSPLIMRKSFSMVAIHSRRAREPQPTWTVWDLSCQGKRPDSHNPAELRGRTLAFSASGWLLVAVGTVALLLEVLCIYIPCHRLDLDPTWPRFKTGLLAF